MYYVGCDQHKKYSFVVVKDQKGLKLDQVKLYHADKENMKNYFSALPRGSKVALETCGFDHWLTDMLQELDLSVKLSHTAKTKAIAEERIKTDKISASVLADLLRVDMLPEAYIPTKPIRDARYLMRYRQNLIYLRTSIKNRIHSIIDNAGIQQSFSDLFGKGGRQFLIQLDLRQPYKSIIDNYLSVIADLTNRINKVDSQLRQSLRKDKQVQLLTTIPGIGVITAHVILAETGDINRFPNHHKFARYIGIVPSLHQSGQVLHSGHITKQGNKYLRTAFVESAQTAIRRDPYLAVKFNKIKAKKGYGVAIVAIGHKLAKSAYVVLKNKEEYRYRSLNG
ncbi:MAG: IS110 family transposase [Candidatus Omnitrophica bacterium]|nr:IS110 family transposase [Candidatus Omnitrophota bacterium]